MRSCISDDRSQGDETASAVRPEAEKIPLQGGAGGQGSVCVLASTMQERIEDRLQLVEASDEDLAGFGTLLRADDAGGL